MNWYFVSICLLACMWTLPWFVAAIVGHVLDYRQFQEYIANLIESNCTLEQNSVHASFRFSECKCIKVCGKSSCNDVCQKCLVPDYVAWQSITYPVFETNGTVVIATKNFESDIWIGSTCRGCFELTRNNWFNMAVLLQCKNIAVAWKCKSIDKF